MATNDLNASEGPSSLSAVRLLYERLGARYREVVADVLAAVDHSTGWTLSIKIGPRHIEALREDAEGPVHLATMSAPPDVTGIAALAEALARMNEPPGSTVLRVDRTLAAVRTMTLPTRDDAYVRAILRNRVERMGPWKFSQALFGYVIDGWTEHNRQAAVRVAIVGRRSIDDLTAALAKAGIAADRIEVDGDGLAPVQLFRAPSAREYRVGRRMLAAYGAVVASLLVVLAGALAYDMHAAGRLDLARQTLGGDAIPGNSIGGNSVAIDGRILADRKAREPLRLTVINEISRLLPDNAWLATLKITGSDVSMTGKGRDVPSIIAALQASRILDDVRFAAPTVHAEGEDAGEFSVSALIRDGGRAAP